MEKFPRKQPERSTPAEKSPAEQTPIAATEPNIDASIQQGIEKDNGEGGSSPIAGSDDDSRIRETENPGDFTPELEDAMREEYGNSSEPSETPDSSEEAPTDMQNSYLGPASGEDPFSNLKGYSNNNSTESDADADFRTEYAGDIGSSGGDAGGDGGGGDGDGGI